MAKRSNGAEEYNLMPDTQKKRTKSARQGSSLSKKENLPMDTISEKISDAEYRTTVILPGELAAALMFAKLGERKTGSEIIREALEEYLIERGYYNN